MSGLEGTWPWVQVRGGVSQRPTEHRVWLDYERPERESPRGLVWAFCPCGWKGDDVEEATEAGEALVSAEGAAHLADVGVDR